MTKKVKVLRVGDKVFVKNENVYPPIRLRKGKIIAVLHPTKRVKFKTQMFLIQFFKDIEGCHDGQEYSETPGKPNRCWWCHSGDLVIQV